MPKEWRAELRHLILGIMVLTGVGILVGHLSTVMLVGVSAYLTWHLVQLYRLRSWISDPAKRPPPTTIGVWNPIACELQRLSQKNRKHKKRLRKMMTRLRQVAQATPDGTIILGDQGDIHWFNEAASSMLGLNPGRDVGQLISNLVRSPAFTEYLEADHFEQPLEFTSTVDEAKYLLLRVVPYGRAGKLLLIRDISRLQRLEQVRKDFVANVSHELRSPLTVVMGYLESIADDPEVPERWLRPVGQMKEQAGRMYTIVEDLLRLSGLEHDPGGAGRHLVSMAEMLGSITAEARRVGNGAHIFSLDVDPELQLLGEYNELFSACSNLVLNAFRYTPENGKISIMWHATDTGGRLEVRDTGIGIESHHIPRLTERFYRVDKARSRELGGTGLGLAIVKHVLMRHDSQLEVESEIGEGSCFSCEFPLSRIERVASKVVAER